MLLDRVRSVVLAVARMLRGQVGPDQGAAAEDLSADRARVATHPDVDLVTVQLAGPDTHRGERERGGGSLIELVLLPESS